jgi:hypothetical protein
VGVSADVQTSAPGWPPKIGDLYEVRGPRRVREPRHWFPCWGAKHTAFDSTSDSEVLLNLAFVQAMNRLVLNARRID